MTCSKFSVVVLVTHAAVVCLLGSATVALDSAEPSNRYVDPMDRFSLTLPEGWAYHSSPGPDQAQFIGNGRYLTIAVGPPRWGVEFAIGIIEDRLRESVRKLERLTSERRSYEGYRAQVKTFKGSKFKVPLEPDVPEVRFFIGAIELPRAVIMASSTVADDLPMDVFEEILASVRPVAKPKKKKKKEK